MSLLKTIKNLLLIVLLFGIVSAGVDYYRITNGLRPIFCQTTYNEKSRHETFRGLFYIAERKTKHSPSEELALSSNIKYRFLIKVLDIKLPTPVETKGYALVVRQREICPSGSKLYAEFDDKKIYIDCIEKITYKEKNSKKAIGLDEALQKDENLIEEILGDLSLVGMYNDEVTEVYVAEEDIITNKKLYVYRCNSKTEDIYITLNNKMERDYCSVKNDSLNKEEQ